MNDYFENVVEDTLINVSSNLVNKGVKTDKPWTKAIQLALTSVAYDQFDLCVYTNKNERDQNINAWLYDLVMYEADDEYCKEIRTINLIMECEWNKSFEEIKYDFYKLIQGRAAHRLLIFQSDNVDNTLNELEKIINFSTIAQKDDRFLLCGWDNNDGFTFRPVIKT
jgi:hypothetical protein